MHAPRQMTYQTVKRIGKESLSVSSEPLLPYSNVTFLIYPSLALWSLS